MGCKSAIPRILRHVSAKRVDKFSEFIPHTTKASKRHSFIRAEIFKDTEV